MHTLDNTQVSLFRSAMDAHPVRAVAIRTILDAIKTGAYRVPIERLRHLRTTQGQVAYNTAKRHLTAATFGGTFRPTRSKNTLLQHSGIAHGDLDHLDDLPTVKQRLCADKCILYCFISPSGAGLKLGVSVAPVPDDEAYKHAWQAVADHYRQQYGALWDPSGQDVCRLCFVSWDLDLYVNPEAQLFLVPPRPATEVPRRHAPSFPRSAPHGDRRDSYAGQALTTAVKMIDASTPGNRHFWRCKAAYLLGGYVAGGLLTADEAWTALETAVQRNTAHLQPALKTIAACLEAGMQEPITLAHLEQERQAWLAAPAHGSDTTAVGQRLVAASRPYAQRVFARLRRWGA